jgi:hypothetical protein
MSQKFINKFKKILLENPEQELAAMEDSLDDGVTPEDYDVDFETDPNDDIANAMSRQQEQMLSELQGWIDNVEGFLDYLNGDNPDSIQSKLAQAIPDTIMDKIKTSQQSKIARVASDLASFHQSLLGYKSQSNNAHLKGV